MYKQTVLGLTAASLCIISMIIGCVSIGVVSKYHIYKDLPLWFQTVLSLLAGVVSAGIMSAVASCVAACTLKRQTFVAATCCTVVTGTTALIGLVMWELFGDQYKLNASLGVTLEYIHIVVRAILATSMVLGWVASILCLIAVIMSAGKTGKFTSNPTLKNYNRRGSEEMY